MESKSGVCLSLSPMPCLDHTASEEEGTILEILDTEGRLQGG